MLSCLVIIKTEIDSRTAIRGWKLNNLTSVIHYSLGVFSNYSFFFFLILVGYSLFIIAQGSCFIHSVPLTWLFIIPDFSNPRIHYSFFIPLFIIYYYTSDSQ